MQYVRDDDGQLIGELHTPDVEWDEQQRGWILGLAVWDATRCRRCGANLIESTNPLNDPDNRMGGTGHYVPVPPTCCFSCMAVAESEASMRGTPDRAGHKHPEALMHRAELVPRPVRAPKPPKPGREQPTDA